MPASSSTMIFSETLAVNVTRRGNPSYTATGKMAEAIRKQPVCGASATVNEVNHG